MGTCIVFLLIFTCKLFKIHIVFSLGFSFDTHALCRICFLIVRKYFPELQWIDVLMGADNLSSHCSEANLRESRERFDLVKMVWSFTPGGCTDVVAGPDNSLVQLEKLNIRRYYRDAVRANPDKWRKPPGKGGHTEADRRRIYSGWVSQARKELLEINFAHIWHSHEEVGLTAKCDGSEESKIILRDGKRS